jgi:soluble lytic murein transglycosylase
MGLDPFLVMAIARRESAFNSEAISRANARGLMQVLPQTARRLSGSSKMETPEKNVKIGAQYFSGLLNQFQGQTHLALAAYNAGPNRRTRG